ncbi:carboxymethylenebutenolidase [Sporothrix brasiliensis 5110]|uniref:Carboxymethylenebutenolidase n=1 Tax=Sporothrix brasiliensis 5110 TaxID=1398154 RepID=A0A0C2F1J2_9PEZI|nr:carboxymethylenebutenolidase [Sporothrix brasiliensis 5110]KIH92794.1 carboxymethylenebutenolidase [Sporothrix brasiliensis 5110]
MCPSRLSRTITQKPLPTLADTMFTPTTVPPAPLPMPQLKELRPGLALLPPLSRRGTGPGLLVVCPSTADPLAIVDGVPWPLVKWAEESYTVVHVQPRALKGGADRAVQDALAALSRSDECTPKGNVGIVVYGAALWNDLAAAIPASEIAAAVVYAGASEADALAPSPVRILHHFGGPSPSVGRTLERTADHTRYWYPAVSSGSFAVPWQPAFHAATEAVAHTRSLAFLKPLMGGPYFDLELLWDEHIYYEFGDRSVAHTMATMVQEPYVNHVPTLTGGIGRASLSAFYRDHFIFCNSPDTALELISRTVGVDRVVDEFLYTFTHDRVVDWMLPGVPPTGRRVEAPFTAVVNIRGDRLYHEHIAWDQGTVLAQLGLLPAYLPFPYPVAGAPADQKLDYRLPVAGIETANKLRDKNAEPSNQLFGYTVRVADEGSDATK